MTRAEIEALYRSHGHAVYRRALRLLQNEDDALDIMHDVFVGLQRDGERFANGSSIATYLYSVTTHASLNWLRNRRTRARLIAGYRPGPEAIPARGEGRALAVELLATLSPDDAALAIYLHCDELTHAEIAELRGCSARQVRSLAERVLRQLQEEVA